MWRNCHGNDVRASGSSPASGGWDASSPCASTARGHALWTPFFAFSPLAGQAITIARQGKRRSIPLCSTDRREWPLSQPGARPPIPNAPDPFRDPKESALPDFLPPFPETFQRVIAQTPLNFRCVTDLARVATRYRSASTVSSPPTPSSSASTFNTSSGRCGSCCNAGRHSSNRAQRR